MKFICSRVPRILITLLALSSFFVCPVLHGSQDQPTHLGVGYKVMDFGTALLNDSVVRTETVVNHTSASVTISQAVVTGAGFQIAGLALPLTLSPGEQTSFDIAFSPTATGNFAGALTILSDCPVATPGVYLTGVGLIPGQLAPSLATINAGRVAPGKSVSIPETFTNSGGSALWILRASSSLSDFQISGLNVPAKLKPSESVTFNVIYSPTVNGSENATLSVKFGIADYAAGNHGRYVASQRQGFSAEASIALSGNGGTPGQLTATPAITFGSTQVGGSSSQTAVLTNSGSSPVTVTQTAAAGNGFSMSGLSVPMTLSGGQSYTFTVVFSPQAAGKASGNISVTSNGSNPTVAIPLSGTGAAAGQLSVSPGSLTFGTTPVGSSSNATANLSASGSSVTISSANVSSSEFSISGLALPVTIPAGQSVPVTITFTPQTSGTASASLSFANTANSPASETLTGTGASAPSHAVDLSWVASTSQVSGYRVYRGSTTGGPYTKLTSSVNPATNYIDASVQAGQTYYYVTTAVDNAGNESTYSNETRTAIPTP
ncbi:MAG: choice-of-anchor D domain-containing protein [Acidobacteriales bacterium]|nr:choice-of-anchor D domain-containing protein [Terriglobales bacterium]